FLIAGAVPLLLGAVDWLRAADRELALRSRADEAAYAADAGAAEPDTPAATGGLGGWRGVDTRDRG
ncbi:MAG TPA: hypothetical protein VIR16_07395, partial [Candidatus Limnocylindrales bacterium]